MDSQKVSLLPSPELKANLLSRILLLWVVPFLKGGAKQGLKLKDVFHCLPDHSIEKLGFLMERKWKDEVIQANLTARQPKLWRVIAKIIWFRYALIGVGYAFNDILISTLQLLVFRAFIRTFISEETDTAGLCMVQFILASTLVFVTLCHALFKQYLVGSIDHLGIEIRLGVSSLIYRKVLKLRKTDSEQANVGKLCNLLSTDVDRIDKNFHLFNFFYLAPIQILIYTYFLWNELGIASLGGICCIFFILPLQVLIGRTSMFFRLQIGKRSDERGRFLNEIISGIRLIKMYAWEIPFASKISSLRGKEIHFIRKSLYFRGIFVSVQTVSANLIPFCALVLYVVLGNPLTADKAFFCISIFSLISKTILHRIPTAASQLGDLLGSLARVESFMMPEEDHRSQSETSDSTDCYDEVTKENDVEPVIVLKNYSASWTDKQQTLRNLTINLRGNKLVMVVGHVAAGKSSLLNTILSELPINSGTKNVADESYFKVKGRLSYASQEPFIFPASIRQNILFGLEMDEERYWETIHVCCLSEDLEQFPHGDLTLVGERGVALSGGQKARVNLARAIYQNADIYLLDDALASLDAKVGKFLFNECIKRHLDGKLRILVTHQLQYLPMADHIIVLNRDGRIWGQGSYEVLQHSGIDFSSLIRDDVINNEAHSADRVIEDVEKNEFMKNDIENFGIRQRSTANSKPKDPKLKASGKGKGQQSSITDKKREQTSNASGVDVYIRYLKSGGSSMTVLAIALGSIITQSILNFTDYWLSQWTNTVTIRNYNDSMMKSSDNFYIYVYVGLIVAFIFTAVSRSLMFFRYCMKISINLHDRMFRSVVGTRVKFFDENPSGRIMNRFTKDLNQIDEQLPISLYDFIHVLLTLFGALAINISANYFMVVPAALLLASLWKLRTFYMRSARDLKNIEALSKSPIFTHVTMTVQGLTTIRALRAESRVLKKFYELQDLHTAVYYMRSTTSRWLTIWLEVMSVMFLALVCFGFLMLTSSAQGGNVGVAISAILSLAGGLQWGMKQSTETESHMTSVARALEYCDLEAETSTQFRNEDMKLPAKWPHKGGLVFDQVSLAYDEAKVNKILKEITFSIKEKEKVGIVGRSGSGKSSLITALFRLTEPCNGTITIDNVPIDQVGLHILRSRMSIIPQDPVLFSGTLRYNLDPFDEFEDDQLMNVLKEVDLQHAVQHLDHPVTNGGSNFSQGQKQLLCLARALLKKNKILVLDEATANIDPMTAKMIQHTVRKKFSDCTILTIAHRLDTVLDNEKIMVLDAGKIVEFNYPDILLKNEHGAFHKLFYHQANTASYTSPSYEKFE